MQPPIQYEPRLALTDGRNGHHLTVAFPDYVAHKRARAWIHGRRRHLHPAQRGEAPQQLPRLLRPVRRRARRGPHLHLQRVPEDAGPTNNWIHPRR
jgi:hypothetical protein